MVRRLGASFGSRASPLSAPLTSHASVSKRPSAEQVAFAGQMFVQFAQTQGQLLGRVADEAVHGVAVWGRPSMDMKNNLSLAFIFGKVTSSTLYFSMPLCVLMHSR